MKTWPYLLTLGNELVLLRMSHCRLSRCSAGILPCCPIKVKLFKIIKSPTSGPFPNIPPSFVCIHLVNAPTQKYNPLVMNLISTSSPPLFCGFDFVGNFSLQVVIKLELQKLQLQLWFNYFTN